MSAVETINDEDHVKPIVRALRKRIVSWMYPPQHQLLEKTIAEEFGVSRNPVRQALGHLAAEGLVVHLPHRGFRVQQLQLRDVEDLYEFRLALETRVVYALAHKGFPQDELLELQSVWQSPAALTSKSTSELASLDESFHASLASIHGNKLILHHLTAINERLFVFRELDMGQHARPDSTCDEHTRILHAIVSRNAAQACEIMQRNILGGLGNAQTAIVQLVARSFLNNH